MPPLPNKNAVKTNFTEIFFIFIKDIWFIPLVISNKPVKKLDAILFGIFKYEHSGEKKLSIIFTIPEVFNIEIITEKSTIKPPIIRVEEIAVLIPEPKTSPKLLNVIFCNLFWDKEAGLKLNFGASFFQNLKIKPTVIELKICVKKSKKPIRELPKSEIPHVPIIKRGLELLVKLRSLSHSSFEHKFLLLKSTAIFAPTGYPC